MTAFRYPSVRKQQGRPRPARGRTIKTALRFGSCSSLVQVEVDGLDGLTRDCRAVHDPRFELPPQDGPNGLAVEHPRRIRVDDPGVADRAAFGNRELDRYVTLDLVHGRISRVLRIDSYQRNHVAFRATIHADIAKHRRSGADTEIEIGHFHTRHVHRRLPDFGNLDVGRRWGRIRGGRRFRLAPLLGLNILLDIHRSEADAWRWVQVLTFAVGA